MPAQSAARGEEPPMFLQRPSTGKSQDVRHILAKQFRELFTRDAVGPDTMKNLAVSKGGDDPYHERYVDALQKVFDERQRRMEEAAMLERHIMQAQARAMSADERELNKANQTCDNYGELGLPPGRSNFRSCIDTELLKKHKLLTPSDYATEELPPIPPPLGPKIPSYARETLTSRQHTREDLYASRETPLPVAAQRSKSDLGGSVMSEEPLGEQERRKDEEFLARFPRNDAWKCQLSEEQREQERVSLNKLQAMTNYTRNPRYVPPSAPGPGRRSLLKVDKPKPKEIGIQPKQDRLSEPQEHSQVFLVSPPAVIFSEYKVGQVYELTLTLKNVSSCIRQCRALPASTPYFSIGLGLFPGEHGLVAPGMSCHYAIRFAPDSLRDFEDEIVIQTQSTIPIKVPVLGKRLPPKLTLPPVIDVGYCLVGGCHVTQLIVKNEGGPGRFCIMPSSAWPTTNFKSVVHNGNVPIPPFDIRPAVLEIGKNDTIIMDVVFQPPAVKSYSVDMCMVCDNCTVRHFTIKGEAQKAGVELVSVERGTTEPLPGELTDATAKHLIRFDSLNPFTYTDRSCVVKNLTNVSLPFQWMIYKPQFDSPGSDSISKKYDRVPDVDSVFSIHPPTGVLPPAENMEFKITYAPPIVDKFHSALHLLLNMVPPSVESISQGSSASREKDNSGEDKKEEDDTVSEILLHQKDMAPFVDVTALEVEVKGESTPLNVVLHPYAIHVPGKNLIGTTLKKMVTMANHSHSTITFQWEPYIEKYILEVEPPFGELDPGMAMDMELCITGPETGKIDHTLYCHVMNLEEPLHLQVQAEFKGPEMSIDEPDLNFGLVQLGRTVMRNITVNNMSQIITTWSIQDSPAFPSSDDDMALSEFVFEPSGGELKPLESKKVSVIFQPRTARSVKRVIEITVEDGKDCNISCFAEVQVTQVCLEHCELAIPEIYKNVPVVATAKLINQTLLPAAFEWGKTLGEDSEDCRLELEPKQGLLEPREEKEIIVQIVANRTGDFSDLRIPCKIEGMETPLILAVFCDVRGLIVTYGVSEDGRNAKMGGSPELHFGDDVKLGSSPKLYLHLKNNTGITAQYHLSLENFFSKPPTPPSQKREEEGARPGSARRMLLGRTPNLADPLSKTMSKANADLCSAMLSQGKGTSFVPSPAVGIISAFTEEVIEILGYSDMWGQYTDKLICKVGELDEVEIPVSMTVVGCPLSFQMTASQSDLRPIVRFGSHVAGTATCKRSMRVNNTSPYDIRVDWETYNTFEDDKKLTDLIVTFGKAFPLLDKDGNEIVPPTEAELNKRPGRPIGGYGEGRELISSTANRAVPAPLIREPTDYIPNSEDTSLAPSREISESVMDTSREGDTKPQFRPKVVAVVCRPHQGQKSATPYSVKPTQMVIPAKGHANIFLSFTPFPTDEVPEDVDCNGFMLGFLSLDSERAAGEEGLVTRAQTYLTEQIRLDMTAHLKPALLTIECGDEEGMRYRSAMSSLLQDNGGLKAESLMVNSVMLSNLTLTPLTFRLVTNKPFIMVELDPSSNRDGSTRAQSTDMHTLKPRHNLVVKVAFQTTTSLLSEIASDYLNNEDDLSGGGRKIEMKDNLIVEFNNTAKQLVPLHATLTVPQFTLSKESLDFGVCLVGQTRELQLMLSNLTSSHTQWSISQESRSVTCALDTFRVEPVSGLLEAHITHISDSKVLLHVFFTPKHAEDYETVFAVHGILGETPRRLYIRGQGSYDEKHEAILNV